VNLEFTNSKRKRIPSASLQVHGNRNNKTTSSQYVGNKNGTLTKRRRRLRSVNVDQQSVFESFEAALLINNEPSKVSKRHCWLTMRLRKLRNGIIDQQW